MKKSKKMNTYLKYGIILLCAAIGGGFLGIMRMGWDLDFVFGGIMPHLTHLIELVQANMALEVLLLLIIEVFVGESAIKKMKALAADVVNAEDEEGDRIEYEMEKLGAVATGILNAVAVIGFIVLSTGYSIEYIRMLAITDAVGMFGISAMVLLLAAFFIFMLLFVYQGYWGVRFVKMQQKIDPKKKGDPTSIKFTEQWVESCDEAEKELIYQSAFNSFTLLMKWCPILMAIALFMHMFWDTGITAVVFIGIVNLMLNVSYLKNGVVKRKQKLNR